MRSIFSLLRSFGSAGALQNARTELELAHRRHVQAAVIVRRIDTIDAVAARYRSAGPGLSMPVTSAA